MASPINYLDDDEDSLRPDDEDEEKYLSAGDESDDAEMATAASAPRQSAPDDVSYLDAGDESIEPSGRTVPAKASFASPSILPASTPATPASTPALDSSAYSAAAQRVADIEAQKPRIPQPKWWQRALAGGLGAAAGVANAKGTGRPIDPTAGEQNILAPGYGRRLADWQNTLDAARAQQGAEQQKLNTLEQIQRINAQSQNWESNKPVEISQEVAEQYGIMPSRDGKYYAPARSVGWMMRTQTQQPKPAPSKGVRISKEAAGQYGIEQDDDGHYYLPNAAVGSLVRSLNTPDKTPPPHTVAPGGSLVDSSGKVLFQSPKPPKEIDPLVEERRRQMIEEGNARADASIENAKQNEGDRLSKLRNAEVQRILTSKGFASEDEVSQTLANPKVTQFERTSAQQALDSIKAINRQYAPRLQAVQDRYASAVRKRYGQDAAQDFDVNPDTLAYTQRQAGAAPPQQQPPAPKPAPPQAGTTPGIPTGRVKVISPTGQVGHVPASQLKQALAEGYKQAQ